MKLQAFALSTLMLGGTNHLLAQVEKVAIRTSGISCGVCAAVSEINLRRLSTIQDVTISRSKESIVLTYKPTANFDPRQIRAVLKPLQVGVLQFQVTARGHIQEEGARRLLIAGSDKFVLVPGDSAPSPDASLSIEAIVDDTSDPMELKILTFKPLR